MDNLNKAQEPTWKLVLGGISAVGLAVVWIAFATMFADMIHFALYLSQF